MHCHGAPPVRSRLDAISILAILDLAQLPPGSIAKRLPGSGTLGCVEDQIGASMTIDAISSEYVSLAFALEGHVEGFVDAYYGPPEPREHGRGRASAPGAILDDI